jgi:hypothetical protein
LSIFISQSYSQSPHNRLALRLASWHVFPFSCEAAPTQSFPQGLCSSVATTFNTPLLLGGPSSVRQQTHTSSSVTLSAQSPYRLRGAGFLEQPCVSPWAGRPLSHVAPLANHDSDTGSSIAEIVSAFPTCGGLCVSPSTSPVAKPADRPPLAGILHPRSSCPRGTGQL